MRTGNLRIRHPLKHPAHRRFQVSGIFLLESIENPVRQSIRQKVLQDISTNRPRGHPTKRLPGNPLTVRVTKKAAVVVNTINRDGAEATVPNHPPRQNIKAAKVPVVVGKRSLTPLSPNHRALPQRKARVHRPQLRQKRRIRHRITAILLLTGQVLPEKRTAQMSGTPGAVHLNTTLAAEVNIHQVRNTAPAASLNTTAAPVRDRLESIEDQVRDIAPAAGRNIIVLDHRAPVDTSLTQAAKAIRHRGLRQVTNPDRHRRHRSLTGRAALPVPDRSTAALAVVPDQAAEGHHPADHPLLRLPRKGNNAVDDKDYSTSIVYHRVSSRDGSNDGVFFFEIKNN